MPPEVDWVPFYWHYDAEGNALTWDNATREQVDALFDAAEKKGPVAEVVGQYAVDGDTAYWWLVKISPPETRRRGIGTKVVERFEQEMRDEGVKRIVLHEVDEGAKPFWTKMGYVYYRGGRPGYSPEQWVKDL